MPAKKILLFKTLENLSKYDFEKFKMYLNTEFSDRWTPIAKSRLESTSLTDIVDTMVSHYGEKSAVSLTLEILREVNCNEAEKLESACRGGKTPAAPTSSAAVASAAAPAAPAAISAQGGSVIIAPTVMGGTSGSWNVTINK